MVKLVATFIFGKEKRKGYTCSENGVKALNSQRKEEQNSHEFVVLMPNFCLRVHMIMRHRVQRRIGNQLGRKISSFH